MDDRDIYELDTDALLTELSRLLTERGYDVTEQVPAGVWWLRSARDPDQTEADILAVLHRLVADGLRKIEQ